MSEIAAKTLRGLLIQHPRIAWSAYAPTLSTLTQAGPLPGSPEPYTDAQDSDLVLEASGAQASGHTYRVTVSRSGMPGPDAAGFTWRDDTSGATAGPYGWEPPITISAWEAIEYSAVTSHREPHAIRLLSGNVLSAFVYTSGGASVRVRAFNASTEAWGSAVTVETGVSSSAVSPCLLELPSGRVMLFFWVYDATSSTAQIRAYYSDDEGATWTRSARGTLATAVSTASTTLGRFRAAYKDGQILLIAHVRRSAGTWYDRWIQFASSDLGTSFTEIEESDGSDEFNACAYPDLVVADGAFVFACIRPEYAAPGYGPSSIVRRLGDAYTPISLADVIESSGIYYGVLDGGSKYVDVGDLALVLDEDGVLYMYGRQHATGLGHTYEGVAQRSTDGGATWSGLPEQFPYISWWTSNDTATYPKAFCAVAQGGRVMLLHTFAANPGTADGSLCCASLGGYSTITLPSRYVWPSPVDPVAYASTWAPFDLPENAGGIWTLAMTGAPTAPSLTGGYLLMQTGLLQTISYTTTGTPGGTLAQGLIEGFSVTVVSGTAYVLARIGDGANTYEARVSVTTTGITLRDEVAGSNIVTVATTAGATGVHLRIDMIEDAVVAYYAPAGLGAVRTWTLIGASTTLTSTGAAGTHRVRWAVLGDSEAHWTFAAYVSDVDTGQHTAAAQAEEDLSPRNLTSLPTTLTGGLQVRATDGPGLTGQAWSIPIRYSHGVENIFAEISPSPRRPWRSTSTAAQVEIAVELSSTAAEDSPLLGGWGGLYLGGINFEQAVLLGRDSAGTWQSVATVSAKAGQTGLRFKRDGDIVQVDTGPANIADHYYPFHILEGSTIKLTSGGTSVYRRILGNSEGAWTNQTTKRPHLRIEGALSTDPGSGTAEIWSKEAVVVWHNAGTFTAYKLRIAAGSTADGYFQIGVMRFGHVAVFGAPYSWGRALTTSPNYSLSTGRSGGRRARSLGPSRRAVEFGWTDGVDTSGVGGKQPVPDYFTGYTGSTTPIATQADATQLVAGLAEHLSGPVGLLVYLPSLAPQANSTTPIQLADRRLMLYGRMMSAPRIETVSGEEYAGEVVRLASIAIEEEV